MTKSNSDPVQDWVVARLSDALEPPFRAGVLILTCAPQSDRKDIHTGDPAQTRQVSAVMMNEITLSASLDSTMLVRGLREVADQLERTLSGRQPMPDQSRFAHLVKDNK